MIERVRMLHNLVLPLSFILPICMLFLLYPDSFQITWGAGRAPYLVFLWIACLEFAIYWRKLPSIRHQELRTPSLIALVVFLTIPTAYALAIPYTGLTQSIIGLGRLLGVPEGGIFDSARVEINWPVAFELVFFSVCFFASTLVLYGKEGLSKLGVAFFFLWAVAAFNMADTFFPFGRIWILQIIVPFTVNSSASILGLMGYGVRTMEVSSPVYGFGTALTVFRDDSAFSALVFWPSAGVHSMIIYTLTILLFINRASIPIKHKAIIFLIGAVGTFTANVLRIVTIIRIGLENGALAAQHFHDYYGEFFFTSWMIIFLIMIAFRTKIMERSTRSTQTSAPNVARLVSARKRLSFMKFEFKPECASKVGLSLLFLPRLLRLRRHLARVAIFRSVGHPRSVGVGQRALRALRLRNSYYILAYMVAKNRRGQRFCAYPTFRK